MKERIVCSHLLDTFPMLWKLESFEIHIPTHPFSLSLFWEGKKISVHFYYIFMLMQDSRQFTTLHILSCVCIVMEDCTVKHSSDCIIVTVTHSVLKVTRKQRRKEETPEKQPPTKAASTSEGQSPPESGSTPSMNEGQSPPGSGHAPGMSNKKSPLGSHSTHSTSEGHSPLKLGSDPSKSEGQSLPESGSAPSKGAKLSSKSSASHLDDSVNNHSQDVRSVTDNSASKSGSHLASEQKLTPKSKESESALGKSAAKEQGSAGSGKKRRPRIAANFNFDSSKWGMLRSCCVWFGYQPLLKVYQLFCLFLLSF